MSKNKLKISVTANAENTQALITIDGNIRDWNSNSATSFKSQVSQLVEQGIKDAMLYINSGGGDCLEANEIANIIAMFPGTIKGQLGALCASAASYIACQCSYVSAAPNNSYMIHKPSGTVSGNLDEIQSALKLLQNLQDEYLKAYVEKTGLTADKIEAMWVRDYWMNAEEAKKLGFIDEILGEEAEITEDDVDSLSANGYKSIPKITATIKQIEQNQPNKTNNMDKKIITTALAMDSASTDDQILAAFQATVKKAGLYDAAKVELETTKTEALTVKINAELDTMIANKQIVAAQREFYRKNFVADFEGTKTEVAKLTSIKPLSAKLNTAAVASVTGDRTNWTFADYREKDPKALEELAETEPETFERLAKSAYGANWIPVSK